MAECGRFKLVNKSDLEELLSSAGSENTQKQVKYAVRMFEDYLKVINCNLCRVNELTNAGLDEVLGKFYASARQKNGELYSKKSMLTIRFGLQRHFLNTRKVDIIKDSEFSESSRVFKSLSSTLKKVGKGQVFTTMIATVNK